MNTAKPSGSNADAVDAYQNKPIENATETPAELDPFNPENLIYSQDFAEVGAKKLLTTVPARKPGRQDFVRVHPGRNTDYRRA